MVGILFYVLFSVVGALCAGQDASYYIHRHKPPEVNVKGKV